MDFIVWMWVDYNLNQHWKEGGKINFLRNRYNSKYNKNKLTLVRVDCWLQSTDDDDDDDNGNSLKLLDL